MSPRTQPRLVLAATALLAAALGAGAVVLLGTVDEDPTTQPGAARLPVGTPVIAPASGELRAASSCAELLDFYVARGLEHVGPTGWRHRPDVVYRDASGLAMVHAAAPSAQRAPGSATGTNVQESGVDEPDLVKTDGELLVRLTDTGVLRVLDVTGADAVPRGEIDLGARFGSGELLLVGDTALALTGFDGEVEATSVDLSDPGIPEIIGTTRFDGALIEARQHDDTVRLVLAAPLPDLDFMVRWGRKRAVAVEHNRALVRRTTLEDWLPTVTVEGRTEPLVDCSGVAVPSRPDGLGTVSVVGLDPRDQSARSVTTLAASADLAYLSEDRLYLATAEHDVGGGLWSVDRSTGPVTGIKIPDGRATVHAFELADTATTYVASGHVDGTLADRWSMDEHDGVLRLAVERSRRTDDATSVVTLAQRGDTLVEIGRVEAIGVRQDLTAVRWFDHLALLVTFRRIDPVHAIYLRDPAAPRDLGELEVPGFSAYLHPLGPRRVIGLGEGPTDKGWGAQAGLFDVTDLSDLRRTDALSLGRGTRFAAAEDPRQLTWLPEQRTLVAVVERGWSGEQGRIVALHVEDGRFTERTLADLDTPTARVRTVPLPDGRLVLSTDEGARLLGV
ncbi:hypothetical protein GHK92_01735 [Nocardioides sp. dk4132]|uniref:beta-propeller domain-containing protein n=1 Tax=unclassified Nocardioides TaxID=2615069 RepID=UPI001294D1A5|nr:MULTISPECIES: beta-propeller domain-containing protein [unclassified Nocardioides]MQW74584.1 hypothetical protein [Nocardioides sp. dk4132]QGA06504.1 hypothetical protein GFH29_03180 [Nocardioides sp. dk884]